jgi:DNA primase
LQALTGFRKKDVSHGADLLGRCPFHDDREPSLVISPEKNLWHCLGECQTGGSVIDWVMKTKGVSFRYAVELLKADHPSLAAPAEKIDEDSGQIEAPRIPRAKSWPQISVARTGACTEVKSNG